MTSFKRLFSFHLLFIFSLCSLLSCQKSLESQAKEHLKSTMREVLKNPDAAILSNARTVYSSDSVCIIDFDCKAQNGFGGYTTNSMEYIYLIDKEDSISHKKVYIECIASIGNDDNDVFHETVLDCAEDFAKTQKGVDSSKKVSKDYFIGFMARLRCYMRGRKVDFEQQKGEDIKL